MNLRPAALSDLALLHHWDTKPHVIAATGNDGRVDWEAELSRSSDWGEWLIAEVDGRPVGIMQVIDPAREESHYWGNVARDLRALDIWIGEETDLGRGYGTQMMRLVLEQCFSDPAVRAVLLDPLATNTRAHRFYERLGFRPIGRRTFGDDDCLVFRLERGAWSRRARAG